jgi:hypothetical protein
MPTDLVAPLQQAAAHFNSALFESALPEHVVTLQRSLRTDGDFLPERWRDTSGHTLHEIALNPQCLAGTHLLGLMTTLVRQQGHLWQHTYGTPSRSGYHNVEWSQKMSAVGFKVVALDGGGQRQTGQRIELAPTPDGSFLNACVELASQGFGLAWIDRGFDVDAEAPTASLAGAGLDRLMRARLTARFGAGFTRLTSLRDVERDAAKRKVKYRCAACQANVWGRQGLALTCGVCGEQYQRVA